MVEYEESFSQRIQYHNSLSLPNNNYLDDDEENEQVLNQEIRDELNCQLENTKEEENAVTGLNKKVKKERKMLFDRGYLDNYDENEESRLFAVRNKAFMLKEKLRNDPVSEDLAKQNAENYIKKIKSEWPALFGQKTDKIYVHVDLDSFYASVETLMNPQFKDVPLGVGSTTMLAACNYKAREYGVKAGMPGYQAKELCPMLVITKVSFEKYNYYSETVMEILSSYDPEIEIYGIDEGCLIFDEKKLKKAYEYFNTNKINGRSYSLDKELIYDSKKIEEPDKIIKHKTPVPSDLISKEIDSHQRNKEGNSSNKQAFSDSKDSNTNVFSNSDRRVTEMCSKNKGCSQENLPSNISSKLSNDLCSTKNNREAKNSYKTEENILNSDLIYTEFSFEAVDALLQRIRAVVHRNTGLTISAGMSVCRGLSKFSSKINKPNGQYFMKEKFDDFLLNLDVDEINGIGKFTKELLQKAFDIKTIRDLRENLYQCSLVFKQRTFENLASLSFGLSLFDLPNRRKSFVTGYKSHGIEMTFPPTDVYADLLYYFWNYCQSIEARVLRTQKGGRTVTIYIKYITFEKISKRKKGFAILRKAEEIFNIVVELLQDCFVKNKYTNECIIDKPIRFLGLNLSELVDLNETDVLERFSTTSKRYKERECMICGLKFLNEPQTLFEFHVNQCLNTQEKQKKAKDLTLKKFFNFK